MNARDRLQYQRSKEQQALKLFLLWSVLGSLAAHGLAMMVRVGNFWTAPPDAPSADDLEVVIAEVPADPPAPATTVAAPEEPSTAVATVQEVAIAAQLAPAPLPLAPQSQAPLPTGEDAPSRPPAERSNPDPVSPMTNAQGDPPTPATGSGPMIDPAGQGFGFGWSPFGTGFNGQGQPTGQPGGQPGGQVDGNAGGVPNGKPGGQPGGQPDGQPGGIPSSQPGETATRTAPAGRDRPSKPVCLDCPKPRFRGSEGSARVTYDIGPDGKVTNVRLRQSSGNAEVDRETIEALSKWRFDPNTIPQGGRQNVRTRVTFEEAGSNYQRQNEQRRQDAHLRRPVAEPAPAALPATPPQRQPAAAVNEVPAPIAPPPVPKTDVAAPPPPDSAPVLPPPPAPVAPPPVPIEAPPPPVPIEAPPVPLPVESPAPASLP